MADTTYRIVHREDDSFAVEIKRVGALPQTAAGLRLPRPKGRSIL